MKVICKDCGLEFDGKIETDNLGVYCICINCLSIIDINSKKEKEEVKMKKEIIMENLAKDIYDWCKENDLWDDNIIYFNSKAWTNLKEWNGINGDKIKEDLYEYKNKNPKDYFEYANPNTLSMSFEGGLNHVLNAYVGGWIKLEEEFKTIFEKYGYYFELGHSWNLSIYEM